MKIVLIGAGNLAGHLGPALKKNGHSIEMVYSRSKGSAKKLAANLKCAFTSKVTDLPTEADLYLLALPDHVIPGFLKELSFIPACIAHTSGSVELSVFKSRFKNCGVFYPLQTFSKNRKVDFKNIPICLEASNPKTLALLKKAAAISKNVVRMNSAKRKKVHLAAVIVNNFPNLLFSLADDLLKEEKLNLDLLRPLILETALKVQNNPPFQMQTGPARRGDAETLKSHRKLLSDNKTVKDIYNLLSKTIENKYGPLL